MRFKELIAVLMVLALPLGLAGTISAQETSGVGVAGVAQSEQVVKGIASRIEGSEITIKNDVGERITVTIQDPETLMNLKVGDRVLVKDGKVIKQ